LVRTVAGFAAPFSGNIVSISGGTMTPSPPTGIHAAWSFYRKCAATSAYHKKQVALFTKLSLWLGIAGAAIATIGQVVASDPQSTVSKVAGIAGSIVVALAGVAATQATAGNRDKLWVKARAAGEAIKSSVYLYCASVPPFDGADRASVLAERVDKATQDLQGAELRPETVKDPPGPLTVADYINARVDDQVNYYTNTAIKHQERADFWRFWGLAAASSGAILGAVSAMFSLAPWVALLSTVVASVTAYVKGAQYATTIALYQATASRLMLVKDKWLDSGKGDADRAERNAFIQSCEDIMSLENGAWVAKWAEQTPKKP
jgi:SMODS and SLOG-associating 2TM effector domain 1/SMODS and SLOG-associating 2TM effector domain 3